MVVRSTTGARAPSSIPPTLTKLFHSPSAPSHLGPETVPGYTLYLPFRGSTAPLDPRKVKLTLGITGVH